MNSWKWFSTAFAEIEPPQNGNLRQLERKGEDFFTAIPRFKK
ncbi:hypothetical protein [Ruminococcus sp.]